MDTKGVKTIIDVIEVDSDSNVEVRLKLLNEIGSTPAVITNFNDIKTNVGENLFARGRLKSPLQKPELNNKENPTVTESNNST